MRVIQVLVPDDVDDEVRRFLRDEEIDYVTSERSLRDDGTGAMFEFPLPTEAVEYVLEGLRDAGLTKEDYTVALTAETATGPNYAALEERFVAEEEDDDSIAPDEIRTKARGMNPGSSTYYAMTFLSALVATSGLLLDSPAVVVGSMVIAPQVGSSLMTSVGSVLNDRGMIVDGIREQAAGLTLAIVGAAAFGWLLKTAQFVPSMVDVTTIQQISGRISPGLLSLTVGVCAGAAGAFGLATALPVSLVGVMVAAALIPAAAAVGIGIAWGYPTVALGAFVLLLINAVSINFTGFATFWYLGYRPDDWEAGDLRANLSPRRYAPILVTLFVLSATLVGAGALMFVHVSFENEVNTQVENVLKEEQYADLELMEVDVEFTDVGLVNEPQGVTVTVSRASNLPYPDLAERLANRISEATGRQVEVQVEFVERRRYTT